MKHLKYQFDDCSLELLELKLDPLATENSDDLLVELESLEIEESLDDSESLEECWLLWFDDIRISLRLVGFLKGTIALLLQFSRTQRQMSDI